MTMILVSLIFSLCGIQYLQAKTARRLQPARVKLKRSGF